MSAQLQAVVTMCGMMLDALGGLLLAYDLLGGRHGPLRMLVRITVYTILYGLVSGLILGFKFGLIAGVGLGTVLGIDLGRKARGHTEFNLKIEAIYGVSRVLVIGLATGLSYSWELAGVLTALLLPFYLIALNWTRMAILGYRQSKQLTFDRRNIFFALGRGVAISIIGFVSVIVVHGFDKYCGFGIKLGLSIGLSLVLLSLLAPAIEWWSDQLPERSLGIAGAVMFVIGFWIQALPYIVVLLGIPLN